MHAPPSTKKIHSYRMSVHHRLDLRPPIPSLPRFGRLDLCLCADPNSEDGPPALDEGSGTPRLPFGPAPPAPAPPTAPEVASPAPARGVSRPDRSLGRSVEATERAAVRDGFCSASFGSREWRWEAARRARSWTDLNLSRSSIQRMELSSRDFRRVPLGRSYDVGPVWAVLMGEVSTGP